MGRVKIITGTLRGRWIDVPDEASVRPTLSRVRETFFSWIRPKLPGSVCLDLFAGSGVLGFEALSEGAGHVVFVDSNTACLDAILDQAKRFGLEDRITLLQANVPNVARLPLGPFDCVFLDPPYDQGKVLLEQSMEMLAKTERLHRGSVLLGEWGCADGPNISEDFQCLRLKKTKHLHYAYWCYTPLSDDAA